MSTEKGSAIGSDIARRLTVRRIAILVAALSVFVVATSIQAQTAHATSAVTVPATAVGSTSVASTVSFVFDTGGTIAPPVVLTLGAPSLDFKDAGTGTCNTNGSTHSYAAGQTCTVNVTFSPAYPGQRLGAVQLLTSGGAVVGTGPLSGVGNGPFVTYANSGSLRLISQTPATPNSANASLVGIVVDGKGDVFVGDNVNGVLREIVAVNGQVSPSSQVVPVGSGIVSPGFIAIDGSGNLFVIDTSDNSVKEIVAVDGVVSATSSVVTLAGGYSDLRGVAVDGSGNVYFSDFQQAAIYELVAVNGTVTPSSAIQAIFSTSPLQPQGLQLDAAGNIHLISYYSGANDSNYSQITAIAGHVSPSSTIQTQCATGASTGGFTLDAAGDAFSGIPFTNSIYECDPNEGTFEPLQLAVGSPEGNPVGVAFDGKGHFFVTFPNHDGYLSLAEVDTRTPPTLAFPTTPAGSSSAYPIYVTLQNTGNQPLTFSPPLAGTNPSANSLFSILTGPVTGNTMKTTCPQLTPASAAATLGEGSICVDFVDFEASGAARPVTGQLVTTDNDLNVAGSSQTNPLTGIVSDAITVAVTPGEITSGTAAYTLQATVTFAGPIPAGPLTFTVDGLLAGTATCTSASSTTETCTLTYNASTLSVGVHTVTATETEDYNYIQTSSTDTNNLTVTPRPLATPQATLSTFPSTPVGSTSAPVTITFTFNAAGSIGAPAVLTLGAPTLDYKDAGTGTCTTNGIAHVYAAGNTCTVNVTFTPSAIGNRFGTVVLTSTGNGGMASANLGGLATAPLVIFTSSLNPVTLTSTANTNPPGTFDGIAVDGKGDIVFADQGNAAVKMLVANNGVVSSTSPVITLGSGFTYPTGVAVDGRGDVFVNDYGTHQVKEIVAVDGVVSSTSQVVVLASGYTYLYGIAVDANENVFFVDAATSTLNKLSPVNGVPPQTTVPTVIGPVSGGFGVKVADNGDVFVGGDEYIQQFVAINGAVTPASTVNTFQDFGFVLDFAVDNAGNLFVSDSSEDGIVQFYPNNQYGSQPTIVSGDVPGGLALDGKGHLFALTGAPGGLAIQEIDLTTPPTLTFPNTLPGATSAYQTVLVENEGNLNLTIPVLGVGSNPSISAGFVLDPNFRCPTADPADGPAILYVGQVCGNQITFAPTGAAGTINGQLVTTDNDLNAPAPSYAQQIINLVGISTNTATVAVTAETIIFGTPSITLTATITYGGPAPTAALTFTVDSVPAGTATCTTSSSTVRTCTLTYDSSTLTVGQHTVQAAEAADVNYIQVSNTDTNNLTVKPAPVASGSQPSASFPTTAVGSTSSPMVLTFTFNESESIAAPAVLTKGATGLDFKDAGTGTCTTNGTAHVYAPASTCTVAVTFSPTLPGQRLGAVQLLNASGTVIATTYIYGTGTGPLVTFPSNTTPLTIAGGLSTPEGMAVDGNGDVFITVPNQSAVEEIVAVNGKVSPTSSVITVGSGFSGPWGVAVDGSGNVFVSDSTKNAVYEILAVNGSVSASSTVAEVATGFSFPQGIAVDAVGDVFVADTSNQAIKKISAINGSTSTVSIVGSGFQYPTGVAAGSAGDVFVADETASSIKQIVASGGTVSASSSVVTVGSGFTYPIGVAVDTSGNVYVANTSGGSIKEIVAVNGTVSSTSTVNTLVSGLSYPYTVTVDSFGNVYFPNANATISELDLRDPPSLLFPVTAVGSISTAQTIIIENTGNAPLTFPAAVSGSNPSISTGYVLGAASTCPQLTTSSSPATLAVDAVCTDSISFAPVTGQSGTVGGQLITTDTDLNVPKGKQIVSLSGATMLTLTVTSLSPNQGPVAGGTSVVITGTDFTGATAVSFGSTPAKSFTVNSSTQITAVAPAGTAGSVYVTVTTPTATSPNSVQYTYIYPLKSFTASGFPSPAILTEPGTVTVTAINTNGTVDTSFTGTITLSSTDPLASLPASYTFQPSDNGVHTFTIAFNTKGTQTLTVQSGSASGSQAGILVSDAIWVLNANGTLVKLNVAGHAVSSNVGTSSTAATNGGVAFDASGDVWAVDNAASSVFSANAAGSSSTTATGGGVNAPSAVAVDGSGYIWIANQAGNTVSVFTTAGQPKSPSTGYGSSYVTGDKLNAPSAIAIDRTGGVWVANKTGNSVTHIFGAAAPVVTPTSAATAAGTQGTKP